MLLETLLGILYSDLAHHWVISILSNKVYNCFIPAARVENSMQMSSSAITVTTCKLLSEYKKLPLPLSSSLGGVPVYFVYARTTDYTDWQWPLSGLHSIMMEKSAHPGDGGGVHALPLSLYLPSRAKS
jgi:hypothetical protein